MSASAATTDQAAADQATTELAIETLGLTKRFGRQTAVDGIDLRVPRGSVFGFLGPNGSGKTTTIRVMLGLATASSGQVSMLGHDVPTRLAQVLPRVGALIEGPAFYPFLSGAANLHRLDTADRHAAARTRRARIGAALNMVGLSHAADKKVRAYSLGMKQRLGLANALLAPRELLILDEPTNGLDPQGTREVRNLVRSLAANGTTVFVSSHLLAEIEQVCTHAAVLSAGRLVAQGTIAQLRAVGGATALLTTPDTDAARTVLIELGLTVGDQRSGIQQSGGGDQLSVRLSDGGPAPEQIVAALVHGGVRVRGFSVERASLEERFVALTGEGFDVVQ